MATGIPVGEKGVTSKVSIKMSRASPQLQPGGQRPGHGALGRELLGMGPEEPWGRVRAALPGLPGLAVEESYSSSR